MQQSNNITSMYNAQVVCRLENLKQFYAHRKPGETERQRYQLTSMLLRQEVVWREVKLREEERTQLSSPHTPRSLSLSLPLWALWVCHIRLSGATRPTHSGVWFGPANAGS